MTTETSRRAVQLLKQHLVGISGANWLPADSFLENAANAVIEVVLTERLPKGMTNCTITFAECRRGHGRLSATNWIEHPCQTCEVNALKSIVTEMIGLCAIGDVDEGTHEFGWGELIFRAKELLK